MTLVSTALGQTSQLKNLTLVLLGSMFIAIAAQVSVPMFPVPMTLQTLAILVVGLAFGARLGIATVAVYLGQGAMGLPVFANFGNVASFAGPTAGFLIGFLVLVGVVGFASDRGWTRSFVGATGAAVIASALLYVPGLAWPLGLAGLFGLEAGWAGADVATTLGWFMTPFLIGDAVKAVLAALVVTGAWAAIRNRQS